MAEIQFCQVGVLVLRSRSFRFHKPAIFVFPGLPKHCDLGLWLTKIVATSWLNTLTYFYCYTAGDCGASVSFFLLP